ncbi:Protein F35D11.5 [Aphelenchoides avenae]|nr:Protein F35D11.5 [Aphelenchus avenae]
MASSAPSSKPPVIVDKKASQVAFDEKSEYFPPVAIEDLPRAQRYFAKSFEKLNEERIKDIFRKNYKNMRALAALAVLAISIYVYTIVAVKQETFLEEIDQEVAEERGELPSKNP